MSTIVVSAPKEKGNSVKAVRRCIAALAATGIIVSGTIAGAQETSQEPGLNITSLTKLASQSDPEVADAVNQLLQQAGVKADTNPTSSSSEEQEENPVANYGDSTEKQKFWTPALAVGCGVGSLNATGAFATVQPGPNYGSGPVLGKSNLLQPYIPSGHAFFHMFTLDEKLAPKMEGTDVKVAWLNLKTFRGDVTPLDDSFLGADINAQTSKLVNTGKGPVIAAIAGKVAYPGDEVCTVLPTIGTTTVN